MLQPLRSGLRRQLWWVRFRELNREGWGDALVRRRIQNAILRTPPQHTAREGSIEVRALTWRRDWKNLIWALKSFYHFAACPWPLYIHDGGLTSAGRAALKEHFPDACFPSREETEREVTRIFAARGLSRCLEYRHRNPAALKLFDFFALSKAQTIVTIDSDVLFFAPPCELLDADAGTNLYNRDSDYWYSMSLDDLEQRLSTRPPSHINSGLARIDRCSIDFDAIEQWLAEPGLFNNHWVTEQTLHALCAARYQVKLLPPSYQVATGRGGLDRLIAKHYPGNVRHLLYQEGMRELRARGFLEAFTGRAAGAVHQPALAPPYTLAPTRDAHS